MSGTTPWGRARLLLFTKSSIYTTISVLHTLKTTDFIRTGIYDQYSGSMKISPHLEHTSRCQTAPGTDWSDRWTWQLLISNTGCNYIRSARPRWIRTELCWWARCSLFKIHPTLETTQGQLDGLFGQLPFKIYLLEVASVGD